MSFRCTAQLTDTKYTAILHTETSDKYICYMYGNCKAIYHWWDVATELSTLNVLKYT